MITSRTASRTPAAREGDRVATNRARVKSVEESIRDTDEPGHRLKRHLSGLDLAVFGVGVIIGTGIFVLTGVVARDQTGPAVALSFVIAGVVCGLAALCYAEFASTVPVAGSAYTFSYATFGELVAWIIGWDLVLELALGAATVAVGWSGYLNQLLTDIGIPLPASIAGEEAVFNIPAVVVVAMMTAVLILGIKLSSRVTTIIVAIKVAIVLLVIVVGVFFVKAENYRPFVPPAQPPAEGASGWDAPLVQALFGFSPGTFGWGGVIVGAAIVFFAFIGFDIVATAAEETKDPKKDMPRGILGSLVVCTTLYVAVSLVVVGMQRYTELSPTAPLAGAFSAAGMPVFSSIISIGALAGLTSVVMILLMGQSRVLFAMSRDHLLPPTLGAVHPKYGTPYKITLITASVVAVLAAVVPLKELAELVNIGTLFAFVLVSIGVIVLRRTRPDLPRAFRVPLMPVLPIVSALACLWLMANLPVETWVRFLIWMAIGVAVYFGYGRGRSRFSERGAADRERAGQAQGGAR
jgi:basic amino acid/polyamine antiporter, APA family